MFNCVSSGKAPALPCLQESKTLIPDAGNMGDMLHASCLIPYAMYCALQVRGIDVHHFGELLMSSGIVLNDEVRWITFHSGYDFGYLLKVLTCLPLPDTEPDFFELLRLYFPCIFDIKVCARVFSCVRCFMHANACAYDARACMQRMVKSVGVVWRC